MKTVHRLGVVGAAAITAVVVLALPAGAHVSVNPGEAPKGGFTKISFRVPNERNVATTQVEVAFPADSPIAFVSTRPVAGWTASIQRMTLAKPIPGDDGENVTEAVSRITWTGGTIEPGEFQEFDVSLGPLPDNVDRLEFKALQTYANGEVVRWIDDPPAAGEDEPENPAPVLALTSPKDDGEQTVTVIPKSDDPLARAAVVMAALALVAAGIALLRGRSR